MEHSNLERTDDLSLKDYWKILSRRKWVLIWSAVFITSVGGALALFLPPMYESESTIMIERQAIPTNLVATTVTGYVQEQIEQIRQRISSYENLLEISQKHDLYPSEVEDNPVATTRRISEDISVTMLEVETTDPNRAGSLRATIAFTVAFAHSDPATAQAVASDLANKYIAENLRSRTEQARDVSDFLDVEAEQLRSEISELEDNMAAFKQDQLRQLPELMNMNLKLYENTENAITTTQDRIRQISDKIEGLEAELSLTPPFKDVESETGEVLLSAEKRLSALTAQFIRASSRYSNKHPDVIKYAREIRMLAEQTSQGARADELLTELTRLQDRLRVARQSYKDDHPEIGQIEQSISAIQRGLQTSLLAGANSQPENQYPPDNPRYVSLRTQITTAQSNRSAAWTKLATDRKKLAEYEERLFNTPGVERDFRQVSIDYQNANRKYNEIKNKQLEARLAEQLETGDKAQKFVLISDAFLPTEPVSPNRIGIMLLSLFLAAATGLVIVSILEFLDNTIRGVRSLAEALGTQPLAVIPDVAKATGATLGSNLPPRPQTRGN